jgi:myo-inositol-1(or 4)-monophosphatase
MPQPRNGCRPPSRLGLDAGSLRGQTARAMHHSALLNVMIAAARKAARALKRDFGELEKLQVSLKGPANFVTAADRRAEETLHAELMKARPGYGFLGEEGGRREGTDKSHTWIVDPLDGTTNFLHGIPQFAISIGLEREGTMVAGLIYNPANDEMFIAERGKGAFLNEQRIRVAGRKRLADAVVACGLPHIGRGDPVLARKETNVVQERVTGLRRFGAAALDLAWVAAGRLDGYWERDLKPWDMAAGLLMVREAGGFVSDCDGGDEMFGKGHIAAGNETIQKELLSALKAATKA